MKYKYTALSTVVLVIPALLMALLEMWGWAFTDIGSGAACYDSMVVALFMLAVGLVVTVCVGIREGHDGRA